MQFSDAGFNVSLLCAGFFAPRDDGIEGISHATKISLRLCTCLLALQRPRHIHVIAEEDSPKATQCAVELFPVIGVRHRRPLAVFVAAPAHVPLITRMTSCLVLAPVVVEVLPDQRTHLTAEGPLVRGRGSFEATRNSGSTSTVIVVVARSVSPAAVCDLTTPQLVAVVRDVPRLPRIVGLVVTLPNLVVGEDLQLT